MHKKQKYWYYVYVRFFLCCLCACSNFEKDRSTTDLESEIFQEESVVSEKESSNDKVMEQSVTESSNDKVIEQSAETEKISKTLCPDCQGKGFVSCPPCEEQVEYNANSVKEKVVIVPIVVAPENWIVLLVQG